MDEDGVVTPDVQPTGRPNARLRQTLVDMVRSMAVVLVVVFAIVLLAWRPQPEAIKVVDPAPVVALAASTAEFERVAPTGLPVDWRPTSARWESTDQSSSERVLHIGYVTSSDQYAQVSVAPVTSEPFLDEQTGGGSPTGSQAVGDATWERRETDERRSLVLVSDSVSTVVSGSAGWAELVALADALEPVPGGQPVQGE